MSYLTQTEMELNLPALSYDVNEGVIKVGEREFPVDANLPRTSPWVLVRHNDPNQLPEAEVCVNIFAKLIGTPKFHKWLGGIVAEEALVRQVRSSTTEAMRSVFTTIEPTIELTEFPEGGPFGFNMYITDNHHPILHTVGNCACVGPNPEGRWVGYGDWSEGYCEYDFHNTDSDTQVWSLLAGMGHLASLAHKDISACPN